MNRDKTVDEIVRVLEDEFPTATIYAEDELGKKVKPYTSVIGSEEEFHESITGASEMMIDLMVAINDEDGGGVDFQELADYVCTDDFKAAVVAGAVINCHRVERSNTELERENTTSKQMLGFKMWVFS
jgi:hypothetical protein